MENGNNKQLSTTLMVVLKDLSSIVALNETLRDRLLYSNVQRLINTAMWPGNKVSVCVAVNCSDTLHNDIL